MESLTKRVLNACGNPPRCLKCGAYHDLIALDGIWCKGIQRGIAIASETLAEKIDNEVLEDLRKEP